MITKRLKTIKELNSKKNLVIYWMNRDQRIEYNHALIYAQKIALEKNLPLLVIFLLQNKFLLANWRHYHFMLVGLTELLPKFNQLKIDFLVLNSQSVKETIKMLIDKFGAFDLVTDFSPLKIKKNWLKELSNLPISIYEVDTHNIVPYHQASDKQEFAAFTLRKKIKKQVHNYLKTPEPLVNHPFHLSKKIDNLNRYLFKKDLERFKSFLKIDLKVLPTRWFKGGRREALKNLKNFINDKLPFYQEKRNELFPSYQSNLSPYLHFGQISALEIAQEVIRSNAPKESKEAYLEELIIRKELADNFCFYQENHDNYHGIPFWAQKTLTKHLYDKRQFLYSLEDLENAKTHDNLWNACQIEMVKKGKMNGYLRMYWAKKILEWSQNAQEAIEKAIYLNDKYEIDGRDPNGYVGILWSIGGLHDRPFFERSIYGLVRYMSKKSIEKKYDVKAYIDYVNRL